MSDGNSKALAIVPRSVDEVTDLAERFSKSALLPVAMRGKMPDVLVTIMAGQELGLAPMASLRAFHVIEGKPVMAADAMVAIVLGSGKAKYFKRVGEATDTSVTYETCRVGDDTPQKCTWTIQMAKTAGLHLKDNWRAYPRAMLANRAKAELARDVYPDVLAGCYTAEELDQPSPSAVAPASPATPKHDAIDAEVVSESVAEHPAFALIDNAPTVDALKALGKTELAPLKGAARAEAKRRYDARMLKLEEAKAHGIAVLGPVETDCADCGEQQFSTESGITCANGHGGAESVARQAAS